MTGEKLMPDRWPYNELPPDVKVHPSPPEAFEAFPRLYAQFVGAGDLVFDIGANIGENAGMFAGLGAQVVAVEPIPRAARAIPAHPNVTVVESAVGAEAGEVELMVNSRGLDVSSASPEWRQRMVEAGIVRDRWDEVITVPVTTLDALIEEHGQPRFVKVDVEGYELEVLRGLSSAVPALSLEVHAVLHDKSVACVHHLEELGLREFALSEGHTAVLSEWMSSGEVIPALGSLGWGDLYARA